MFDGIVFYNKLNLVKDFVLNQTLNLLIGVESRSGDAEFT
ncbi:hypothetical protein LEP1GSC080_2211 [Leptospira interrogans str. FPW2026]|nr:hypothetical protein LEP1GSC080_2211 [Leptospira interrogans str. FPW2026]